MGTDAAGRSGAFSQGEQLPHLDRVPVDLGEVPDLLLVGAQAGAADVPRQVAEVRIRQHRHVPWAQRRGQPIRVVA